MAYSDHIDLPHFFTLGLSGLPGIISNVECPLAWGADVVDIGGEEYEWIPTLDTSAGLRGFEERVEMWDGSSTPDRITIRCRATPTLLGWLDRSGSWPQLTADLDTTDTTATVDDADIFLAEGYAYVADETVRHAAGSGTTLPDLVRGRYRSVPRYHVAEWDGVSERDYAGAYVSSTPLTHRGRVAWLHVCPCVYGPNGVVPVSATAPDGDDGTNWLAATGVVERFEEHAGWIEIEIADLTMLIDRPVVSRQPAAEVGHGDLVQVDGSSFWCRVDFTETKTVGSPQRLFGDLRSHVSAELVTPAELAAAITAALVVITCTEVRRTQTDDGAPSWQVHLAYTVGGTPSASLMCPAGPTSIWSELGLEDDSEAPVVGDEWVLTITTPRPRLRLPSPQTKRTIWLQRPRLPGLWPGEGTGYSDVYESPLHEVVQVGDELMLVDETTETVSGRTYHGVTVLQRGLHGTLPDGPVLVADGPDSDPVEVRGGLGLQACEWPRAILYALCSGYGGTGDYDGVGTRGVGAGIPEALVDVTAIERLHYELGGYDQIDLWVPEESTLRDVIDPILQARGCYLHTEDGLITIKPLPPVVEDSTATELTDADFRTTDRFSWSTGEQNVRNVVKGFALAGTESTKTVIAGASAGTWRDQPALEIRLDWHSTVGRAEAELDRAAAIQLGLWSRPFARVDLSHQRKRGWLLRLGEAVTITHRVALDAGQRGVDILPARIVARTPVLVGDASAELTLLAPGRGGARPCYYSPTARGTSIGAYSGGVCVITCEDYYYAPDWTGDPDPRRFSVDDLVRVFTEGDESTSIDCRVTAVSDTSLTVNDNVSGLTEPVVIESQDWDDATTAQHANAYAADGTARPWAMTDGTTPPTTYAP